MVKNKYILLTPGPLTTSETVKEVMQQDVCTWDSEYKNIVEDIREQLLELAHCDVADYTTVLMQGSGTFGVEATILSALGKEDKLLVVANGAYGERIYQIAERAGKNVVKLSSSEIMPISPEQVKDYLESDLAITHVAFVHCETTTGILNPLAEMMAVINAAKKISIVDAMSSFGGIPIDVSGKSIDYIISSANKCIQGVPGFSFIIAKRALLSTLKGNSASLSLDLYDQWHELEVGEGKFRYTSPTHVVLAFSQAMKELAKEGSIEARHMRYKSNQALLVTEMEKIGFEACVEKTYQSPIITTFLYPEALKNFSFESFYMHLKENGFVIYPGKLSNLNVFRIGNIGEVYEEDILALTSVIRQYYKEMAV